MVSMIPSWLRRSAHTRPGDGLEKTRLNLGFIPLTDCAPLVIAKEKGWFAKYGLDVELSKETSWANVRDKVAIGILDGAQMLAPMPIASTLGLGPVEKPTVTALSLDLNGNAITVSGALFEQMRALDPVGMTRRPFGAGPLRQVIAERAARGEPPLTFAVVFPVSTHAYQLRYWMAAAGIDPDRDVRLLVVPPPQMVSQLKAGHIDGFCVGEPWSQAAVAQGLGRVLITSYELWNNGPEKVLGVNQEWAEQYPNTHRALLMALLEAARWLDAHENRPEVVEILSRPAFVNAPREVMGMSMTGTFRYGPGEDPVVMPDFNVFFRFAATFPWRSHAEWFLTQMLRWGQIEQPLDIVATAARVYRPDLYREAAAALGLAVPRIDRKPEGGHGRGWILEQASEPLAMGADRFFDGMTFDPADPVAYVAGFPMHRRALALEDLAGLSGGVPPGPRPG
jgi:ABC-type nitrate/sulfonate/bicarbonate transport system substrate-binding protein